MYVYSYGFNENYVSLMCVHRAAAIAATAVPAACRIVLKLCKWQYSLADMYTKLV